MSEKKVRKPVCEYDLPACERYLAAQAALGRHLTEWDRFEYGEPRDCCFWMEGAEEKGAPPDALRRRREEQGWEYVCPAQGKTFYVWRSRGETVYRPAPRPMEDNAACLRRLRRYIVRDVALLALLFALLLAYVVYTAHQPLGLYLLITEGDGLTTVLGTLLGAIGSISTGFFDLPILLRLRRALREGNELPTVGRPALRTVLDWGVVALLLVLIVLEVKVFRDDYRTGIDVPFVYAEQLGGEASAEQSCETSATLLLRSGSEASQGDFVFIDRPRRDGGRKLIESIKTTHLKVLDLRLSALAKPLARELAEEYVALDLGQSAREITLDGADTAYYLCAGGTQYLICSRGDTVLLYRTDAPQPLIDHAHELLEMM